MYIDLYLFCTTYRKSLAILIFICIQNARTDIPDPWLKHLPQTQQDNYLRVVEYNEFKCDGEKIISGDYFNDNFCDCVDGSDEPLTSGSWTYQILS